MNKELKEAQERWMDSAAIRQEWRAMTESLIFREAVSLMRMKITDKIQTVNIATNAQVTDRLFYGAQAALNALKSLESLGDDPLKNPEPLPAPWDSYGEDSTQQQQ